MTNIDNKFKSLSFNSIEILCKRASFINKYFGFGFFTRRTFDKVMQRVALEGNPVSLETYLKDNIITVSHFEISKVYGIEDRWGDFEICQDMTDEIYNILPSQIKDMIIIQERKRNYYQFNAEEARTLNNIYVLFAHLFED